VRSEDSQNFKCTHILGASRGLLCDSYAVLFLHFQFNYIGQYANSPGNRTRRFFHSGGRIHRAYPWTDGSAKLAQF